MVYEYLQGLSCGTGEPQPTTRIEFTTVDLVPGAAKAFEAALKAGQSPLQDETLWYRIDRENDRRDLDSPAHGESRPWAATSQMMEVVSALTSRLPTTDSLRAAVSVSDVDIGSVGGDLRKPPIQTQQPCGPR